MPDASDERFHPPGPEEQWSDSLYFGGGDGRGLHVYARVGRRPNEDAIEGAAGLWLPDGRFALTFAREPDRDEPRAGAVAFACAEPFARWTIALDGPARLFARPEDLAERGAGETVTLRGALTFSAWIGAFEFEAEGLGAGVAQRHYEQPGSLHGWLEVAGERVGLAGAGMRDHSWGVRDWQGVPWWRWIGMVLDPDTFVLFNQVGRTEGPPGAGGALMLDGRLAPVQHVDLDGDRSAWTARLRDAEGRETEIAGEARSVAPLRQRRDGRTTHVNEVLTTLRWRGEERIGVCEWLAQA